jgi:RHS repeat-associated protein
MKCWFTFLACLLVAWARADVPDVKTLIRRDSLNRLTNVTATHGTNLVARLGYGLGVTGQRTGAVEIFALNPQPSTLNRFYSYDRLHRLTNEVVQGDGPTGQLGYIYDRVGNRLARTGLLGPIGETTASYDSRDRLEPATTNFDTNGNTLWGDVSPAPAQTSADEYDALGRLTKRTVAGKTIALVYDGDGNRVKKIVTAGGTTTTTTYLIDDRNPTGYAQVLEEWTAVNYASAILDRAYAYGLSRLSLWDNVGGGAYYYYTHDGHGSVRLLTDTAGAVTDTYTYDAFGILLAQSGPTTNWFRYAGEYHDPDLGLIHLRNREMNPNTGRFWTPDSFEGFQPDPLSLHKYLYAHANPVNRIDPAGYYATLQEASVATTINVTLTTKLLIASATSFLVASGAAITLEELLEDKQTAIAIEEFVEHIGSAGRLEQADFDELQHRVDTLRRRKIKLYLHYSFTRFAGSLIANGLFRDRETFVTRNVYPTGWRAHWFLALPSPDIQDAVYIVKPNLGYEPTGPTKVPPGYDRAVPPRYLAGGGDQWIFNRGSGGLGSVFGPIPMPTGTPPPFNQ